MFCQLSGQNETNGSLDFARGDGVLLGVAGQTSALFGDLVKDVIDKGVHNSHGLVADARLRVHLLQNTVNKGGEGLVVSLARAR